MSNISAKVICDSISPDDVRMLTLELEYPRFIHSEFMTHRMLSKNAASSRAIPVNKMLERIMSEPAIPIYWGLNRPGMSAAEELSPIMKEAVKALWIEASKDAVSVTRVLSDMGLHKQITNRITEPWQTIKVVCSGTEWANFFYLRNHEAAQPEIRELAEVMLGAINTSTPVLLQPGEWHLPYVTSYRLVSGELKYYGNNEPTAHEYSLEDARIISVSCCAQVSYRTTDDSLEKAKRIYAMLIESTPAHASPVEHQATPMNTEVNDESTWEEGITHIDRINQHWSGNLKGWIQFRKLIPQEAQW